MTEKKMSAPIQRYGSAPTIGDPNLVVPEKLLGHWETRDSGVDSNIVNCRKRDSAWQFPVICDASEKAKGNSL